MRGKHFASWLLERWAVQVPRLLVVLHIYSRNFVILFKQLSRQKITMKIQRYFVLHHSLPWGYNLICQSFGRFRRSGRFEEVSENASEPTFRPVKVI
jgi:hypothetical protein